MFFDSNQETVRQPRGDCMFGKQVEFVKSAKWRIYDLDGYRVGKSKKEFCRSDPGLATCFGGTGMKSDQMIGHPKRAVHQNAALAAQLRMQHRHRQGYTSRARARAAVSIAFVMGIISTIGTLVLATLVSETDAAGRMGCMINRSWYSLTSSSIGPAVAPECPIGLVPAPDQTSAQEPPADVAISIDVEP